MNEQDKELIAEARREYMRKYRANNKERIKAINERYWYRKSIEALKNDKAQEI